MTPTLLAAEMLGAFERIAIGLLAVAGAFVVGHIVTGIVVWVAYRGLSRKKKCPPLLMRLYRLLGAVLTALIVAAIFFGEGGFGRGGGGDNYRTGDDDKGKLATDPGEAKEKSKEPKKKQPEATPEERVRVTMLGDDATEERFYLFEDDPRPKTLAEVQALVRTRLGGGERPLKELAIYTYSNTAHRGNDIVRRLDDWAQQQGLRVSYREFKDRPRPGT